MKVAVVGATGLVGTMMLKVLAERNFPVTELIPVASVKSAGKEIEFKGKKYVVKNCADGVAAQASLALFSAGGTMSLEWAPRFAQAGTTVIDNSSAWRMHPDKKLIVPEVNADALTASDKIIANPNCSTIQMVVALNPLHKKFKIKRIVVSTYQSVSGTGKKAVDQLFDERVHSVLKTLQQVKSLPQAHDIIYNYSMLMAYEYQIDLNVIPQIDVFLENGYTKEEMKMVFETKKIMRDENIQLTATTVRVPVVAGHSEAVNVEFYNDFTIDEIKNILAAEKGIVVYDNPSALQYPMPIDAAGKDEVFVGRLRRDETQPRTLNMWIVSDNLRKGAATNAVQIAESLLAKNLL